jgi:peptide chain release factor subunit 1
VCTHRTQVAELATQMFITNDAPNVSGLVLAGSADFKNVLGMSDLFDQRLSAIVLNTVDVSYGGENGFNQAIELSAECLSNVKFIQEKKLVSKYFEEISQDTGKYCFGVADTLACLDMGAVETLIVWEAMEYTRYTFNNPSTGETTHKVLTPEQEKDSAHFVDKESGAELETLDKKPMLEWLAENYKSFGCVLEFITNKSQEGSQFCRGFGGIGGLLRYQVSARKGKIAGQSCC